MAWIVSKMKDDPNMRRSVLAVVLMAISMACSGEADPAAVKTAPVKTAAPPAAREVGIDPAMRTTATEFERRLRESNVNGQLFLLTVVGETTTAGWNSAKCDNFEAEVIDLLISINRTRRQSKAIAGERTCEGSTRTFKIASDRFDQYRKGLINDVQILNDVKYDVK